MTPPLSSSLLGPKWKHVDSFSDLGSDYSEEEEVEYVTFDLGVPSSSAGPLQVPHYRLVGLDTERPFLQVGNTIYEGAHQTLVGTEIVLRDMRDPTNKSSKHVTPQHLSSRRVRFREVTFRDRPPPGSAAPAAVGEAEAGTSTALGTQEAAAAAAVGGEKEVRFVPFDPATLLQAGAGGAGGKKGKGRKESTLPPGVPRRSGTLPGGGRGQVRKKAATGGGKGEGRGRSGRRATGRGRGRGRGRGGAATAAGGEEGGAGRGLLAGFEQEGEGDVSMRDADADGEGQSGGAAEGGGGGVEEVHGGDGEIGDPLDGLVPMPGFEGPSAEG
ncbi:hypothetical protein CALVIDRAFT_601894 [Calocera viscosa TUFC12733]|uniref:Transcription factor TFIIIC triple barrel domain-containing protein n=1 Tax=Calocera viscosa (strain TUFC12733) TaxID=1330018 RepID=A0A167HSI7_CALVF|nr:hypothetical protein CALVIDRAFT_601894 [Calocera viscosa TUFC12733]